MVEDLEGQELGLLEITVSPASVTEGLTFSIEVRLGWDNALPVNFADLRLGFWDGLPGMPRAEREFKPAEGREVSGVTVNGAQVVCEELELAEIGGRPFRQLRIVRSFIASQPGTFELPESFLNFGREVSSGSFLRTTVEKVDDYYVRASSRPLVVEPLPKEGQPFDFTGAVGRIDAKAAVDTRDLRAGESVKLTVEWTGSGNLEFFGAPELARLDAFDGFRVYGKTEERSFDRRAVTYDLAPLSEEVTAIPAVPLPVYVPDERHYATVLTEPIPIQVRALEGAVELEGEAGQELGRDLRDIDTTPLDASAGLAPDRGGPPAPWVLAALFGVPLAGLLLRTLIRRGGDPAAPRVRRRRRARRRLAKALGAAATPEAELAALYAFLADRSGEPREAWVGRDVRQALAAQGSNGHGVDASDVERLGEVIEELEASVWADGGRAVQRREVLEVADRLIGGGL